MQFLNTSKFHLLLSIGIIAGCTKEKVPKPTPDVTTKWEIIVGDYDVYDTLGAYLYTMNLEYIYNEQMDQDSIKFTNFDGEFTFTTLQPTAGGNHEFYIRVGNHNLLYDNTGNRWKILVDGVPGYNNILYNDTIQLSFEKTNINYWMEDLVPYYQCNCRQVAVKK